MPLWAAAKATLSGFERWTATHVPRAQNSAADALANEALDRAAGGRPGVAVTRARPERVRRRAVAYTQRASEAAGRSRAGGATGPA